MLKPIGDVFIRLLKMLIVPIIFFTVVSRITKMEDVKSLRSVGEKLIVYYVYTSPLVAVIGLVMALIIKSGSVKVAGLIAETA